MFDEDDSDKRLFSGSYLDGNTNIFYQTQPKKTTVNKLLDLSSLIMICSVVLFIFIFLIMFSLGEFLHLNFNQGIESLFFWGEIAIILYALIELGLSLKIYYYCKELETAKKENKKYLHRTLLIFSFISIFLLILLPNFLFFGNIISFNTLPGVSYTSSSLIYNMGNFHYQYILNYLTNSDSILQVFGLLILFFTSFYAVFSDKKTHAIIPTLVFIILLLVFFYSLKIYIVTQNKYSLNLLNKDINSSNQYLNSILNNYQEFTSTSTLGTNFFNNMQNLIEKQSNINNIFGKNSSSIWNYTELNNDFLGYGFFEYYYIKKFNNYGYQITSNNTDNSTLIIRGNSTLLLLNYLAKMLSVQEAINNNSKVLNNYQGFLKRENYPYYYGKNSYLFNNTNYTGIIYYNNYYLENNDYALKTLNYLLGSNTTLFYNLRYNTAQLNNIFYILSSEQYYNYAVDSLLYNQSIPTKINYIGYSGGTTILNLGNISPNYTNFTIYLDNNFVRYYKYYNFIIVNNFELQPGINNVTIKLPQYKLNETYNFYVSPYLIINSSVYEGSENNLSILNVLISNPSNRTIIISKLYLSQPSLTNGFYEQDINNQNNSIFWLAPDHNVSLVYNLYGNAKNNEKYAYVMNMNTSYGPGQYIFTGKEAFSTFVYNKNQTNAIILNSITESPNSITTKTSNSINIKTTTVKSVIV
jgi:hypothetical protein